MLRLTLFGGVRVARADGKEVNVQRRRLALLALVAAHPGGISRERLQAFLWQERPTDQARHSLDQALYALRRELGEIFEGSDRLRLTREVSTDLGAFEQAIRASDFEAAARVYGGPFAEGLFVSDAAELEQWLEATRGHLAREFRRVLATLAAATEERGDWRSALEDWRRLAAEEPSTSAAHLGIMRALANLGERDAALTHARTYASYCAVEFECEPDPAIAALAESLRAGTWVAPPSPAPVVPAAASPSNASPVAVAPPAPAARHSRRYGNAMTVAGALMLALLAAGALRLRTPTDAPDDQVTVLDFADDTHDARFAALPSMSAEWVAQGIAEAGLADVRAVHHPGPRPSATTVAGSIYVAGDSLVFVARVERAEGGVAGDGAARTLVLAPVRVPRDSAMRGLELVRRQVLGAIAERTDAWLASARREPPQYAAYAAYAAGMAISGRNDSAAIAHFTSARALDSTFTEPLAAAAAAFRRLDNCRAVDSVVAVLQAANPSPFAAAAADVQAASCHGDMERRYRASSALVRAAPRSVAARVMLARAAYRTRRYDEALKLLAAIDASALPPELPPSDHVADYTAVLHALGRHAVERAVADSALRADPGDIDLLRLDVRALATQGPSAELNARLEDAVAFPGDRWSRHVTPGDVLRTAALELRGHGFTGAARGVALRAVEWERRNHAGRHVLELAQTYALADRWSDARGEITEALTDTTSDRELLGWAAVVSAHDGDRAKAASLLQRLAPSCDEFHAGRCSWWRAVTAAQLGERDSAIAYLRQAIAEGVCPCDHRHDDLLEALRGDRVFAAFWSAELASR